MRINQLLRWCFLSITLLAERTLNPLMSIITHHQQHIHSDKTTNINRWIQIKLQTRSLSVSPNRKLISHQHHFFICLHGSPICFQCTPKLVLQYPINRNGRIRLNSYHISWYIISAILNVITAQGFRPGYFLLYKGGGPTIAECVS